MTAAPRPPFEPVALRAQRVVLRSLAEADAPAIFRIFSDARVTRYWSRPPMTDPEEAVTQVRTILANYRSGDGLALGVERLDDHMLVGTCTLFQFHPTSRRAEVGYALGSACWGQGLMHEALCRLVAHAFGALALNRLEADIDPRNAASARSLERLGFAKEGHLRERWIVNGEVSDTDLYGLLRRDWLASPLARR